MNEFKDGRSAIAFVMAMTVVVTSCLAALIVTIVFWFKV